MKSYVYGLTRGKDVVYVGITGNPKQRAMGHRINSRNLKMNIIEEHDDISRYDLIEREYFWINEMGRRGHKLLNIKDNWQDKMERNKECPNCGKPIFNLNSRYIGDVREHIDCSKAVSKVIPLYLPDAVVEEVKDIAEKDKRSMSKVLHLLIELALKNNLFEEWKKDTKSKWYTELKANL